MKSHYTKTNLGLKGAAEFAVDGTSALLVTTGAGVVPAVIVHATGHGLIANWSKSLDASTDSALRNYLASKKDYLIRATGLEYDDLQKLGPDQIRETLSNSTDLFRQLELKLPNQPGVRAYAQDLVVEGIKNVQLATLDELSRQDDRLGDVEQDLANVSVDFISFKGVTEAALENHTQRLESLENSVAHLGETVTKVNAQLQRQGRDQAVIADFVFKRMDPAEKVAALRGGFQAESFVCPGGAASCEAATLRDQLIERFEAEAATRELASNLSDSARALGDISTIATNLGVRIPGLDKAAAVANVAAGAFAQYATGNYLGAVASASSLFGGGGGNAQQAQFSAIMKQFEIVNQKLDLILENQAKLMQAVVALSNQLRETQQAIDERLARVEFETLRISEIVRSQAWQPWLPCQVVYAEVNQKLQYYQLLGDYRSLGDMYTILGTKREAVAKCVSNAQEHLLSLAANRYFGNFLSAKRLSELPDEMYAETPGAQTKYFSPSALQRYIETVHEPSLEILATWASVHKRPWSQIFLALCFPRSSILEPVDWENAEYLKSRGSQLLTWGNNDAEATARGLLSEPMIPDAALEVSEWIIAASRFADLQDRSDAHFLEPSELVAYAARVGPSESTGESLIRENLLVVDSAIANYSLRYSDVLARAITYVLFEMPADDEKTQKRRQRMRSSAMSLLENNEALRSNVLMTILHARYGAYSSGSVKAPVSEAVYRRAWNESRRTTGPPHRRGAGLFQGLFGGDLQFKIDTNGRTTVMLVEEGERSVWAEMPSPAVFSAGRVEYPDTLYRLLRLRERLIERLLDYDSIHFIKDERQRLQSTLALANAAKVPSPSTDSD